jgi:hypothetical protein
MIPAVLGMFENHYPTLQYSNNPTLHSLSHVSNSLQL